MDLLSTHSWYDVVRSVAMQKSIDVVVEDGRRGD